MKKVIIFIIVSLMVIGTISYAFISAKDEVKKTFGYCGNCKIVCEYKTQYEQWTKKYHVVRHWCTDCEKDQCMGTNAQKHRMIDGVCEFCKYPKKVETKGIVK